MGLADRLNRQEDIGATAYPSTGVLRELQTDVATVSSMEFRSEVHEELKSQVGAQLYSGELSQDRLITAVYAAIGVVLDKTQTPLTVTDRATLVQEIVDDILGNGPLEQLLRDTEISEVMVARFDQIYVERAGKLVHTELRFNSEDHLRKTIERIVGKVGRRIDESSPLVDARLLDGSRVNAVVPPIALDGATLNIRKFFRDVFTARDMVVTKTISQAGLDFVAACIKGALNVVVSGGTGSGKTTTLNVLSTFIPDDERIVTIEDSAELQLNQQHVVRLETRPTNIEGQGEVSIRDLVRNSLRMRPDRILVGEVRDGAALDMLQAMNTGHDGSITTVHANTPSDALSRLETMALMSGVELPVTVVREQVARAIDLVVQQTRLRDGTRRITSITAVGANNKGEIETSEIFAFKYFEDGKDGNLGELVATGNKPHFLQRLADHGVKVDAAVFKK
ncbi:MAG: CpaF family protein [Micrococcales bacterium]